MIALAHFGSEVAVFKTAKITAGIISPFIVASELCFFASEDIVHTY